MRISTRWISLIVIALIALGGGLAAAGPKGSGKAHPALRDLYAEREAHAAHASGLPFVPSNSLLRVTSDRVVIDAIAESDPPALAAALAALGMQNVAVFGRVVSGLLPVAAIPALDGVASLRYAQPSMSKRHVGLVTSQGVQAMRADVASTTFGVTGAGVKVGVLSDSYNCQGGAATDVSTGDLPPNVQVLQEDPGCGGGTDEGRAMLQIVHDVAPNAPLAFATADGGQANFANNIVALKSAGAKVIVDDVSYFAEPFFQDGIVAQAVDTVVGQGGVYFSAAGNEARQSYESAFRPGTVFTDGQIPSAPGAPHFFGGTAHNFAPSGPVDVFQRITVPHGASLTIVLQWDAPAASVCPACPGANTDLDIYLLNANATQVLAGSPSINLGNDPVEIFSVTNNGATTDLNLLIVSCPVDGCVGGPAPGFLKYINEGSSSVVIQDFPTASSTVVGHANANGAEAVGAAAYFNTPAFGVSPPVLEPFSSSGPTAILFDIQGNRFASPVVRQKPGIVGPDGVNTTFFPPNGDIPQDPDNFPNFFGTSAAAPHAAGAAALLLEKQPSLPAVSIYQALRSTAIDMGAPGVDFDSGYGLIQADAATSLVSSLQAEAAAILPTSRSVQVGASATAFVTVINAGPGQATGVGLSLMTPLLASVFYQTTSSATNQLTGTPNTPVNIPPGGAQSFLVSITPSAVFAPTDVKFFYAGGNTGGPAPLTGINTLLLSSSAQPVPDIIALAATPTPDLILHLPSTTGANAFAVAAANVGTTGSITVTADTGGTALPLIVNVCQTGAGGSCLAAPAPSVTTTINANATPTFSFFVTGTGTAIPLNAATNRIFVRFKDAQQVTRGSTSVAVQTP